jgi:hypothetical protein
VAGGDAIVLGAIANLEWVATGAPMIDLHASGPVRWYIGGFEVAVPVTSRHCHNDAQSNVGSPVAEHLPAR